MILSKHLLTKNHHNALLGCKICWPTWPHYLNKTMAFLKCHWKQQMHWTQTTRLNFRLKIQSNQLLYARSPMLSAASSSSCRLSSPPSNLVNGQELTICDIDWDSPQSHCSLSVKPHFLLHALQWPWPVLKRFCTDHWRRWKSKPGSRIVGSSTRLELTTEADCQLSRQRLVKIDCFWIPP